jgi:hypothetical protein
VPAPRWHCPFKPYAQRALFSRGGGFSSDRISQSTKKLSYCTVQYSHNVIMITIYIVIGPYHPGLRVLPRVALGGRCSWYRLRISVHLLGLNAVSNWRYATGVQGTQAKLTENVTVPCRYLGEGRNISCLFLHGLNSRGSSILCAKFEIFFFETLLIAQLAPRHGLKRSILPL